MAVIGSNATKIQYTGRYSDVNASANDVGQMKRVPTKDMAISYDCPYQKKKFLFIIKKCIACTINEPQLNSAVHFG